ncbi:MAG: DUF4982 domain-containing protein [Bacteroidia bacterium]|nr:DUF4982 domain-containing protein [Bacteroidia bacterium]
MKNKFILVILMGISANLLAQDRYIEEWEFAQRKFGGMWDVWRQISYEGEVWKQIKLPHCFNAEDAVEPYEKYYQGEGWYKTAIELQNPFPGGRTLLHFEGVGQRAEVYIYDTKVGTHEGGYDEFTVDLTEGVKEYQNAPPAFPRKKYGEKIPLAVLADNSRNLNSIPSDLSDFNLYGGIYRKVKCSYVPAISLSRVHISSKLDESLRTATVHVKPLLYNPENLVDKLSFSLRILDDQGRVIAKTNLGNNLSSAEELEVEITNVELWSPQSPYLYTCELTLESPHGNHRIIDNFGIRTYHFDKKGPFFLNGERLLLRGTHRHEDHAGVAGAMTNQQIRKEFIMMKEMGVNFIRLGHYQQSELALHMCDSLGLLVWEEIPWCRAGADSEEQKSMGRQALQNMISQHYNHPAIIIWGLGNEHDWRGERAYLDTVAIRKFMKELHQLSHHLDDNRKTAIRRCNFAKDIVDVYSPSIWAGWYRGIYPDYQKVSYKEMMEVDHFFHAEWGASHFTYRHSENPDKGIEAVGRAKSADEREGDFLLKGGDARVSKDGDWSTTYACNLIDWHLKEQENMTWLTGTAYWPFKDFSTPLRPENPIPYVNQKGVLERDFTKKESFYVFQSYWTENPMVHIYGSTWETRWGEADEEKLLKVYSNCPKVELIVNGKSLGIKKRNSQDFPAAGLRWKTTLLEGKNLIIAKGKMDGRSIIDTLEINYTTKKWGLAHHLDLRTVREEGNHVLVEASLLDENEILCLDARDFVEFGLTGNGELMDNLGTSFGSRRVGLANGKAWIWIKKNKGISMASVKLVPDVGKVKARAELVPAFLKLD